MCRSERAYRPMLGWFRQVIGSSAVSSLQACCRRAPAVPLLGATPCTSLRRRPKALQDSTNCHFPRRCGVERNTTGAERGTMPAASGAVRPELRPGLLWVRVRVTRKPSLEERQVDREFRCCRWDGPAPGSPPPAPPVPRATAGCPSVPGLPHGHPAARLEVVRRPMAEPRLGHHFAGVYPLRMARAHALALGAAAGAGSSPPIATRDSVTRSEIAGAGAEPARSGHPAVRPICT